MKKLIIAIAITSILGCSSLPKATQDQEKQQQEEQNNLRSNTALVVTDTCNATLVIATALTFPFWTVVPLAYGIFTHLTWNDNPNDGTKEVLGLFACTALIPIYAL